MPSAPLVPIRVLIVEDNPGDARLARETLANDKLNLDLREVRDGEAAMRFLRGEGEFRGETRPDLILLDLNLPKKDGREVLADLKADPQLQQIPVVVLSSSQAEEDVARSYRLHANCYVIKPVDLAELRKAVRAIKGFWFTIVKLPPEA